MQATHGGYKGHADAHIATGCFYQQTAGFYQPFVHGISDEVKGHAVLNRTARIAVFELEPDCARQICREVQAQQGGIANGLQNVRQHRAYLIGKESVG